MSAWKSEKREAPNPKSTLARSSDRKRERTPQRTVHREKNLLGKCTINIQATQIPPLQPFERLARPVGPAAVCAIRAAIGCATLRVPCPPQPGNRELRLMRKCDLRGASLCTGPHGTGLRLRRSLSSARPPSLLPRQPAAGSPEAGARRGRRGCARQDRRRVRRNFSR